MEQKDSNKKSEASSENDARFFERYKTILKTYIEQKSELVKLTLIEKIAVMSGMLFSSFLIAFFALIFFLFISVMAGLWLGDCLSSLVKGFGIVALFYFLLTLILVLTKKKIEKPVINLLIKMMFNDSK